MDAVDFPLDYEVAVVEQVETDLAEKPSTHETGDHHSHFFVALQAAAEQEFAEGSVELVPMGQGRLGWLNPIGSSLALGLEAGLGATPHGVKLETNALLQGALGKSPTNPELLLALGAVMDPPNNSSHEGGHGADWEFAPHLGLGVKIPFNAAELGFGVAVDLWQHGVGLSEGVFLEFPFDFSRNEQEVH